MTLLSHLLICFYKYSLVLSHIWSRILKSVASLAISVKTGQIWSFILKSKALIDIDSVSFVPFADVCGLAGFVSRGPPLPLPRVAGVVAVVVVVVVVGVVLLAAAGAAVAVQALVHGLEAGQAEGVTAGEADGGGGEEEAHGAEEVRGGGV